MFELSEATIRQLKYHETIKDVLLVLHQGTQAGGNSAMAWQLLEYVHRRRPRLWWWKGLDRWNFAGLTIALPAGYAVLLNPYKVDSSLDGAAILAHELGHALWNSHGFDSSEEEYYCDRIAGCTLREMLLAAGLSAEEAARRAQKKFPALGEPLAAWAARRRKNTPRHPFYPWTWFDNSRTADIASNVVLGLGINLGVWGHPVWMTRRDLGR